jgi:hypothetical protein
MKTLWFTSTEPLESRIAPAAVFTFKDVDFDDVTIRTSKGTNAQLAAIVTLAASGAGQQLQKIDFSTDAATFAGTDLTITARRAGAGIGDGLVNVGAIDATGANGGTALDLGAISIRGDLGQVDAGDAVLATAAIKKLGVRSMGEFGISTQGAGADLESTIDGALGALSVAGNVRDVFIRTTGAAAGKIGAVTIGGSLIGGAANSSGAIISAGAMGPVKIAGNIEGGAGQASGYLRSLGTLASITIGGSLIGGANNQESGYITGDLATGAVKIGGDVRGGAANGAGSIFCGGNVASISIGGSLVGGSGNNTGRIGTSMDLGPVKIGGSVIGGTGNLSGIILGLGAKVGPVSIGGDLRGGSISGTASLTNSGVILSLGRLAAVTIGGSIIAGANTGSGTLENSGAIAAGSDIGALTVNGSIIGNALTHVRITAVGEVAPLKTDLAFRSISVGGRVEFADILAGYNASTTPLGVNADAQIGKVVVGDWIASNLVAGVASVTLLFGDGDDTRLSGVGVRDATALVSKIASFTIKNSARGTLGGGDHFGIVAQEIGKFSLAGTGIPQLLAGPGNDLPPFDFAIGATGDLRLREVPL